MSKLVLLRGLSTDLDSNSLVDGQILFTEDTNELYIDFLHPETEELIRKPITNKKLAEDLQQFINNLDKVENKSSEEIRNEITYENIIAALGFTPVAEGDSIAASNIDYNNTESGLSGTNVQAALDETVEKLADIRNPFTGTKAEVKAAIAAGEIKEGDIVNITDDVHEGGGGGGVVPDGVSNIVYLTQEEYDALPDDKLTDDIEYRITDEGTDTNADNVGYNNATSGLSAMNVQDAIDELSSRPSGGGGSNIVYLTQEQYDALSEDKLTNDIEYRITDGDADETARNISYDNTESNLEAINVQQAIDKLVASGGSNIQYVTQEEYDNLPEDKLTNNVEYRITDVGVNDAMASNIAYDNSESGIAALNVQGAIDKVNSDLNKLNLDLGGLRFGTDGDGNYGYYGADGSLIPFSVGDGGEMVELWINSTVQDFPVNTMFELNLTDYQYIVIDCVYKLGADIVYRTFIEKDSTGWCSARNNPSSSTDSGSHARQFSVTDEGVEIIAQSIATRCIPVAIYGYTIKSESSTTPDIPMGEIKIMPLVPTLTSNTGSDSGEASANTVYGNSDAWKAFDGDSSTMWVSNDYATTENNWIQYKFTVPTNVSKVTILPGYATNGARVKNFTVQASNDGTDFVDLYSGKCENGSGVTQHFEFDNNKFYLYYRLKVVDIYDTGRVQIEELQFYGYQMEALVPTMTSNIASDGGEASAGAALRSGNVYNLFDNDSSTHAVLSTTPGTDISYFQYRFPESKLVTAITMNNYWNDTNPINTIKEFIIQGSNDGSTFDDIYTGTHNGSANTTDVTMYSFNNSKKYIYYRFKIMSCETGATYGSLRHLQFYAAPEGSTDKDTRTIIDFALDTTVDDWTLTDTTSTTFALSEENIQLVVTGKTKYYANYKNAINIDEKIKLIVFGTLNFTLPDDTTTQYAYGYIEISTDNGATWTELHKITRDATAGETNKTVSFSKEINLTQYKGQDCLFRIGANTTKTKGTVTMTLTTLAIY